MTTKIYCKKFQNRNCQFKDCRYTHELAPATLAKRPISSHPPYKRPPKSSTRPPLRNRRGLALGPAGTVAYPMRPTVNLPERSAMALPKRPVFTEPSLTMTNVLTSRW
ncbi:hypothetical protein EK21DRAFT_85207 [Setomelanomma holmii]|uniref:C3H1-type domain-containing protein n=1 Tax=Setomelanomma holmii TaxID=210430 RepID=A0A9P4LQU8_9PLEO|nr:hypothetical protein EK21DRAFT_85207 [Setomelanomma holmii]